MRIENKYTVKSITNKIFFDYKRTLFFLSLILLLSIYFIVKGSSWPLLFDNEICRTLFYMSEESDHTLYNIGISYLAAYIFYIIQVFIPERKKTQVAIAQTKLDMFNCLHLCKMFLEGWKRYVRYDRVGNGCINNVNVQLIYYEDFEGNLTQITPVGLKNIIISIEEASKSIKENIDFRNSDISLQKLFIDGNFAEQIKELYDLFEEAKILCSSPDNTLRTSYSIGQITEFELRIMRLAMIYKIENSLVVLETKDKEKILRYHKIMKDGYEDIQKMKKLLSQQ